MTDGQGESGLERGLAGDYRVSIAEVIREAWERVSGNKATIWGGIGLYLLVAIAISLIFGIFDGSPAPTADAITPPSAAGLVEQLVTTLVTGPLGAGIIFLGIAIASGRVAKPTSIFSWYDKLLPLFLTYLLMVLMIMLGTLLLVLPGIYLSIAYQMALPLVVDKDMGPWEALETSRKVMTHHWFTFFGLWFVAALAIIASSALLGIPLIWVVPAVIIGIGIVYREAIGATERSLQRTSGAQ